MLALRGQGGRPLGGLLLCLLGLAIVVVQVALERGPLIGADLAAEGLGLEEQWPALYPLAKAFELFGQRALVYTITLVVAALVSWRSRSWRPLLLAAGTLLVLNAVVGSAKLLTARPKPVAGDPSLFEGGIIFPSGHAANAVATWGLIAYLLARHRGRRTPARTTAGGVVAASLSVGLASVYLNTHWITDLLAGWLAGAAVLSAAVLLDRRLALVGAPVRRRREAPGPVVASPGANGAGPATRPQAAHARQRRVRDPPPQRPPPAARPAMGDPPPRLPRRR